MFVLLGLAFCDIFVILGMFVGNSIPAWHILSEKTIQTFYPILYPFGNVAYMGSVSMIVLLSFERFKGRLISKSFSLCSISKKCAKCFIHYKFHSWFLDTFVDEDTKVFRNICLHFPRQDGQDRKKRIETHATKVTEIPKTKKTKI